MGSHFAGAGVLVGLALWIAVGPAVVAIARRFPMRRHWRRAFLVHVPVGFCATLFKTSLDYLIGQALDVQDSSRRVGFAANALVYVLLVLAAEFHTRSRERGRAPAAPHSPDPYRRPGA